MIQGLIIVAVLGTSILSGVLGMAGGMVLMAILAMTLSIAAAMMVHGAVQLTSNASRAWFLKEHIHWKIFPAYMLGTAISLGLFSALLFVPDAGLVLILVGLFPILARFTKKLHGLDITRPVTTVTCGAVVTAAQLLAGASGPLLDVFYLNSSLNKHQVVANKAITQAFGHAIKLVYYGLIIGVSEDIPAWFYGVAMLTAVAGARIGTRLLDLLPEAAFRRWSGRAILVIAIICVARGVFELFSGADGV